MMRMQHSRYLTYTCQIHNTRNFDDIDTLVSPKVRVSHKKNSYLIAGLIPGVTYVVQVHSVIKEVRSEADMIEATTGER